MNFFHPNLIRMLEALAPVEDWFLETGATCAEIDGEPLVIFLTFTGEMITGDDASFVIEIYPHDGTAEIDLSVDFVLDMTVDQFTEIQSNAEALMDTTRALLWEERVQKAAKIPPLNVPDEPSTPVSVYFQDPEPEPAV